MLSADDRAGEVDRVLSALRSLLMGEQPSTKYAVAPSLDADRRAAARARMHLDTATEHLERAVEYVGILEDRLER